MTKKDVSRAVGPFKFFKPENHHNRIAIVGSCVLVALPSGHHAIIDACNISLISGYKWHVSINGCGKNKNIYAVSSRPSVSMHRVLMSAPDGLFVDHINSNGLDNRSANMRLATHAQNMANRRKSKNRRSPFKGVTYDPGNDRTKAIWRAHLTSNGRRYKGPRRRCHFKAAMDYDELSRIYHGEFSRRNIK